MIGRVLANGAFDPAFGTNGVATLGIPAADVDDRPAGGVVVLGANGELRAFTDAGTVDASFATAVPGLTAGQTPSALAVVADGSVLVAGSQDVATELRAWAVRLDGTTGALLQSWNLDGTAALVGSPTRVAVLADGSPVALADGTTVQWFAAAATTTLDASMFATSLAVDSADRVVVAGLSDVSLALTRLSSTTRGVDPAFAGGSPLVLGAVADSASTVLFASGDRPVVLAGESSTSMIVARATVDGTPDASFGVAGVLATPLPDLVTSRAGVASSGSVAADGSLHIGGSAGLLPFVARVTPAGALDPALNGNGVRWLDSIGPFGAASFRPAGLAAVGGDGSIVGTAQDPQGVRVIKLTPGGVRDTSFGTNGEFAIRTLSGGLATTDSAGRVIVAAATGTGQWYVLRLTTTGAVDTSFGTGGVVPFATPAAPVALATTNGGAVTIVTSAGAGEIVRLTSSGALDTGFGTGGRVALTNAVRASILADGSMVVLETATSGHRYSATGAAGAAFSVTGMSLVDVDVDSTGRVVAIGSLSTGATPVVVRFTPTGALDTTFGASGVRGLTTPGTAARIAVDAFDRPYALVTLSGTGSRVDRLTTAGTLDASFATGGSLSSTGAAAISPGDMAFDTSNRLLLSGFFPGVADVRGIRLVAATAPPADAAGPTITITAPLDGGVYEVGQPRSAAYSCSDPSPPVSCTGTVTLPGPFDVSSIGTKTFTVNARDGLGNTSTRTVTYRVVDTTAPFITPISPTNGQQIPRNAIVNITVSCVDPFLGASGLATCASSPSGLLDTSTLGPRTITYTATDRAGNSRTQSITVQIVDRTAPTITVTAPTGRYLLGDTVFANYACADDAGGSGIVFCNGDVPNGGVVPTGTPGPSSIHLVAIDGAGNRTARDAEYVVDDRVSASLARGGVLSSGGDTTPTDPIETTVVAGKAGTYTIIEQPATVPSPWRAITFGSTLTGPETDNGHPHEVTLRLDPSVVAPGQLNNVVVLANGRRVETCRDPRKVDPDPCISTRTNGNMDETWITILTTKGATFVPVLSTVAPPITSVSTPTVPTVVQATDRTFRVTYSFSSAPGKDALSGVFVSDALDCTATDPVPAPTALVPDFSGRQTNWRFEYEAPSSWRGSCRQIAVAWSSGRTDTYLVQL